MAEQPGDESILRTRVTIPEHVVYRDFPNETVVLNLETGRYHGLNATAAQMLEALRESDSVAAARDTVARELEQPPDVIERDLLALLRSLAERGLVEQHAGRPH